MKSSHESSAVGIPVLQGREDVNRDRLPHLDRWGAMHSFPASVQEIARREIERMR